MDILLKTAAALLLAFYAGVAVLALNPDVSEAYRDYYIDGNLELSMAERQKLPPVKLHKAGTHLENDIGLIGWAAPETEHRWTEGRRAKIVFRVDASLPDGIPGAIRMNVVPLGRQRLLWQLNSGAWYELTIDTPQDCLLALAPEHMLPGENVLRLALPDAHLPGNGDTRTLAIAVREIEFLPAPSQP